MGVSVGSSKLDTWMVTVEPAESGSFFDGLWSMTVPLGSVVSSVVKTRGTNPAALMAFSASACRIPTTPGTRSGPSE